MIDAEVFMAQSPSYEYYGLMAQYWDLLRGDMSLWSDKFFYLQCVRTYGQPVLDVGCGTGRLLLHLIQQSIDIDGVDNSPDMLALLRKKADKFGVKPNVYQQQMERLSLPRKYQLILVPSSSFQLLLDPGLPPLAMRRFYEHLLPGGTLVMPFMTLWNAGEPLVNQWTKEAKRDDGALVRRLSWSRYDPATELEETQETYQVFRDGEMIASETHVQSPATRSYTQEQAMALYRRAGFTNIGAYHEFTFEPVRREDTLFCVLGTRP
jgi:ubiquinone/menaquinone biosynthesis C-methylase UbiE